MTEKILEPIELYPKIFVYKNLFKDIEKTMAVLKDEDEDALFSPWTQWSQFGEYMNPLFKDYPHTMSIEEIRKIETKNEKEELQKNTILEVFENFHLATQDYISRNNVEFDKDKILINREGESFNQWTTNGPAIARYRTDLDEPLAMTYHSDYIREPITSPGYKFAITSLTYFNDDYEGGEIDFIVDGEAYMYKPEAGDHLIFPSGHPDILTKEGQVYLHGVMPVTKEKKYICRMYWMKYEIGDDEWFEKEAEFGKDVWKEMQPDIMQKFRDAHPNKMNADKEKRIK
jgi:hypothetical protein